MKDYKKISSALAKYGKHLVKLIDETHKLHSEGKDEEAIKGLKKVKKDFEYLSKWASASAITSGRTIKKVESMV
jgi:hypothetical protein